MSLYYNNLMHNWCCLSFQSCILSTQRRQPPSCIKWNASLISPIVILWVMYSSTLISCNMKIGREWCLKSYQIVQELKCRIHTQVGNYLLQVLVYQPRHLWTALETTKSCSFPNTTSHQLEGSSGYLLPWCSNTHNNWCSPALKVFEHQKKILPSTH